MNPSTLPARAYSAFLFDMDGTLLTSIRSAERVWSAWATRHGLDVTTFLPTLHGKRAHDTIRQLNVPGLDPIAEAAWITAAEIEDVADIEAINGAAGFLASLPPERWGIVTSAPRKLAEARLAAAGLPSHRLLVASEDVEHGKPAPDPFLLGARKLGAPSKKGSGAGLPSHRLLVASEDVEHGKPAPDPFLLGARKLGAPPADCLVFEDTHAGLQSAEAAGMDSIVVTLTHAHPMTTLVPAVLDYADLQAHAGPDGLRVVRKPA
jgi:sugar-phosphatase